MGKSGASNDSATLAACLSRGAALDAVLPAVKRIVNDVRKHGDRALFRYAAQFDGLNDTANLARHA
jgi:histidinol dehydrogenase